MSEGLNDLERSLRELQPTSAATGPMLFAMGRASAMRSAKIWRGVSLVSAVATIALGGLLLWRAEPEVRVVVVSVPVMLETKPASEPVESADPGDSSCLTEASIPEWRQHHLHLLAEPTSDPTDAGPSQPRESRPLGVGDLLKGPLVWSSLSNFGER